MEGLGFFFASTQGCLCRWVLVRSQICPRVGSDVRAAKNVVGVWAGFVLEQCPGEAHTGVRRSSTGIKPQWTRAAAPEGIRKFRQLQVCVLRAAIFSLELFFSSFSSLEAQKSMLFKDPLWICFWSVLFIVYFSAFSPHFPCSLTRAAGVTGAGRTHCISSVRDTG